MVNTASIQESSAPRMSPEKPTVSVVIPAYNAAAYLGEALDSVLAQTYPPLEVIVVDDGSEDNTPQVVATYAGKFTYMRKQRGGPASARNAGIRAASGEWIAFQDADDIWMPSLLEKLVKDSAKTGADLVFCDTLTMIDGRVVGPTRFEHNGVLKHPDALAPDGFLQNPFELLLELGCYVPACAVLIKRDALLQIGLFDESFYTNEDLDLWLRLSLRCRFWIVNEVLALQRVHGNNLTRDPWTWKVERVKVYEKLESYAPSVARGTRWRKLLREGKAVLLREHGAVYLERGEILLARASWAKGFWSSCSLRLGTYWLATFFPLSWTKTLRNWKRQIRP